MRLTKRALLSVISIVVVFATLGCTAVPPVEVMPTEEAPAGPTGNDTATYAHGTTVDSNGNFVFTYDGKTYDSEFDRLMAEDGYVFGIDDNWYGTYNQKQTVLGDNEIITAAPAYLQGQVERRLYNMKALGYNSVNVWIHKDLGGFTFDADGKITGLNENFTTNLRLLLESCRKTNMNLVPSLLNPGTATNFNEGANGLTPEQIWFKYFRFYYDEEMRGAYIDALSETLAILAEYQDVITMVNLAVENGTQLINDPSYANQNYGNRFGIVWEDYASLLNDMHAASKAAMPNVPTTVEDVAWPCNSFKYNDLDVDIIGYNFYGKKASSELKLEDRFMTRPAYVGEFNIHFDAAEIRRADEATRGVYLTDLLDYYYHNGFLGSFYFFYYASGDVGYSFFRTQNSSDKYEDMCTFVPMLTYKIRDLKNEHRGTEDTMDKPALLYNHDSAVNYWVAARGAEYYILERTEDGGKSWTTIADDIDVNDYMMDNGLLSYEDTTREEDKVYNYRVTGVNGKGEQSVSDMGNDNSVFIPINLFVDAKGNYDGGFEQGTLLEGHADTMSDVVNSSGWYERLTYGNNVGVILNDPEMARTGDHCFYLNLFEDVGDYGIWSDASTMSCWTYNLELQPNTTYTLTYWYKLIAHGGFSFTVRDPETATMNLVWTQPGQQLTAEVRDEILKSYKDLEGEELRDAVKNSEWLQGSMTFTTPASGRVIVCLQNNRAYDAKNPQNSAFYLDDIEIFELR